MEVQADFRDLLALFNKHQVDYVVVGGYALAYLGAPRYTGDLDILIRPDPANADRVLTALEEFGFGAVGVDPSRLRETRIKSFNLVIHRSGVDLVTSLTGVTWTEADCGAPAWKIRGNTGTFPWTKRVPGKQTGHGRKKDLADLEALGEE